MRRRRGFCHFTDTPSPSLLKRLPKGERGAPAEWQSSRRRAMARRGRPARRRCRTARRAASPTCAADESSGIPLHPPLPLLGVSNILGGEGGSAQNGGLVEQRAGPRVGGVEREAGVVDRADQLEAQGAGERV